SHRPTVHQAAARLVRAARAQDPPVKKRALLLLGLLATIVAPAARAQVPSASAAAAAPTPPPPAPPPPATPPEASCVEKLPAGKLRPTFTETFPARGLSGHALPLVITLSHGPAETVLPTGFRFQPDAAEAKALKAAGFILPDPQGGAGPQVERKDESGSVKSKVTLSF